MSGDGSEEAKQVGPQATAQQEPVESSLRDIQGQHHEEPAAQDQKVFPVREQVFLRAEEREEPQAGERELLSVRDWE